MNVEDLRMSQGDLPRSTEDANGRVRACGPLTMSEMRRRRTGSQEVVSGCEHGERVSLRGEARQGRLRGPRYEAGFKL